MGIRQTNCLVLLFLLITGAAYADPLSTSRRIDFFREVSSRHLHGMATRSDGRLLTGPEVRRIQWDAGTDLLWSMTADQHGVLIGTGPEGKLLAVDLRDPDNIKTKVELELPGSHLFSVARLSNGDVLAGTSPDGVLVLAREGSIIARLKLPVGSILDIKLLPPAKEKTITALVATGDPGRIFQVDLGKFAKLGDTLDRPDADGNLAAAGVSLWGSVRDDNIRCLLVRDDGSVIAGSAPKGNIYQFPAAGGPPRLLDENNHAEVTALLPWSDGFFAAVTFTTENREIRVKRASEPKPGQSDAEDSKEGEASPIVVSSPVQQTNFRGRSQLIWFPEGGFPEVVASRTNTAFYDLQRQDDLVLISGGEDGELLGYDPAQRRSLTFAGATASQVNAIAPAAGQPGLFYLLGNNPGSLELLDFNATSEQSAETGRMDLGVPSEIGALRFERPVDFAPDQMQVDMRASFGSDELEGWSFWQKADARDGGWIVPGLKGRYAQLRITLDDQKAELAAGTLFSLPQNRRPQLQNFQILSPNFAVIPSPERPERPSTTLAQILQSSAKTEGKSRDGFLNSEVVPQPGTQVALWAVDDPDGDNLKASFSIRATGDTEWTDLLRESDQSFAQFEISHLPEGIYQTRLTITEAAPRPAVQRLSTTFETDDLLVDRTPPQIIAAGVTKLPSGWQIRISARDQLSLLRGVELKLNNGLSFDLEQPLDGILDGQEEIFVIEFTSQQLDGSTSAEAVVLDQAGNSAARRFQLNTK